MKIKQLEWEDCTPTISSNVVSRAQALGYTFEICKWPVPNDEHEENDTIMYMAYIVSMTIIGKGESPEQAKETAQKWLEERIGEMFEDQFQWIRGGRMAL